MSITLDALTLPADLIWIDEFDWTPVKQSESYTLTGALVLESGIKQAGRPITLAGTEQSGWAERTLVKALHALLEDDAVMTLTLHDSTAYSVKFDHGSQPVQARPIIDFNNPADSDAYSLVVKFKQVATP
jgi:hypothetical protein